MTDNEFTKKAEEIICEGGITRAPSCDDLGKMFYEPIPDKNLRDEFAIATLIGILSNHGDEIGDRERLAAYTYEVADLMLRAREKFPSE